MFNSMLLQVQIVNLGRRMVDFKTYGRVKRVQCIVPVHLCTSGPVKLDLGRRCEKVYCKASIMSIAYNTSLFSYHSCTIISHVIVSQSFSGQCHPRTILAAQAGRTN